MRFSLRIFFGYFLLLGLLTGYVLSVVRDEIKPAVRQSAEEVLVDTANLLAEAIQPDVVAGRLDDGRFARILQQFALRNPQASVWGVARHKTYLRVYVTDDKGRVLLDSSGQAVGQDYSHWRDVYLTLRGRYGARSTLLDPNDPLSSIMHVAAPIRDGQRIVGVVTVARPNWALQPYIERSEGKLWRAALALMGLGLLVGALFSWLLSRGITRLTDYARAVSQGRLATVPLFFANRELTTLATALGEMRQQLEGKAYVEHYVHDLTHELKSPLAGISAAAELLDEGLDAADHARFVGHVRSEAGRLQQIVDRLLQLATLEARQALKDVQTIDLGELLDSECDALAVLAGSRRLQHAPWLAARVQGEPFLLQQAVRNLLQNALDFTPEHGCIRLALQRGAAGEGWRLSIHNPGPAIPDYALPRLFERFYSLPRPATGQKGTGLGLALTRTIAELHGGAVSLGNAPQGGVEATLQLPAAD